MLALIMSSKGIFIVYLRFIVDYRYCILNKATFVENKQKEGWFIVGSGNTWDEATFKCLIAPKYRKAFKYKEGDWYIHDNSISLYLFTHLDYLKNAYGICEDEFYILESSDY